MQLLLNLKFKLKFRLVLSSNKLILVTLENLELVEFLLIFYILRR